MPSLFEIMSCSLTVMTGTQQGYIIIIVDHIWFLLCQQCTAERQCLSCIYLYHHELESTVIIIILTHSRPKLRHANLAGQRADPAVFLCWQDQGRGGYSGFWHGGGRPGGQGGRAHDPAQELGGVCPAGDLLT